MLNGKYQIQTDASDGLHATVCNIALLLGAPSQDIHVLRKNHFTNRRSNRLDALIAMLDSCGIAAIVHRKIEQDELRQLSCPSIALFRGEYVVVVRNSHKWVRIVSPRFGVQKFPFARFFEGFSGLWIEVQRIPNVVPEKVNSSFSIKELLQPLLKNRDSYLVVCLSFFLMVLNFCVPLLSSSILDNTFSSRNTGLLIGIGLSFVFVIVFECVLTIMRDSLVTLLGNELIHGFKIGVFRHALRLPIGFFNKMPMTLFLSRFAVLSNIKNILAEKLLIMAVDSIFAMIAMLLLFLVSWPVALISSFFVVFYYAIYHSLSGKKQFLEQKIFELSSEERLRMQETIESLRTTRIFGKEDERVALLNATSNPLTSYHFALDKLRRIVAISEKSIITSQSFLTLGVSSFLVMNHKMAAGTMLAVVFYQRIFIDRSYHMISVIADLKFLNDQVGKFTEIVCTEEDSLIGSCSRLVDIKGNIEVRDLTFRYDPKVTPLFNDMNLKIHAGESVAIIGPSGVGKSTLFALLTPPYS